MSIVPLISSCRTASSDTGFLNQSNLRLIEVCSLVVLCNGIECGASKGECCNKSLYHYISCADPFHILTMSGPLVPQSSSTGFSQQGQVDWVELSSRSVQFSVAVLARLSKAGIDPYTLQVGRAICLKFSIDPIAQELITDAIFQLKKYGSYGNILWFGFGVKQLVTDLAETEQGLTLVALCASLTTTYDSTYSARVLRELCVLQQAPQCFTPALRQWKGVVETCAGILGSSRFILILNGFRRLMSAQLDMPEPRCHQMPTTYTNLAAAILALASIAKNNLVNTTFTGGLDCAWLAAFAEMILSLDVGIFNSSGLSLYRSRSSHGTLPQVTIVCANYPEPVAQVDVLIRRAFLLPGGKTILHFNDTRHSDNCMNWRSPWLSILHDAFHNDADVLLESETGHQLAVYLECMSLVQEDLITEEVPYEESDILNSIDPLLGFNEQSRGQEFLRFASNRLPELARLKSKRQAITNSTDALRLGQESLDAIRRACSCITCSRSDRFVPHKVVSDAPKFCLKEVAQSIMVLLWICLACSIDDDVYPSITGLRTLYSWLSPKTSISLTREESNFGRIFVRKPPLSGLDMVFLVLAGLSAPYSGYEMRRNDPRTLARVGHGLCVYSVVLEDPKLPPSFISKFRVVRGYVAFSGARFDHIRSSHRESNRIRLSHENLDYILDKNPPLSCNMIVQESDKETQLDLAYLVKYLHPNNKTSEIWLDLDIFFRNLYDITKKIQCAGRCKSLYQIETFEFAYYPWRNSMNAPFQLEAGAIDNAQQSINSVKDTNNTWILIMRTKLDSETFHFTNNHLSLYLILGNDYGNALSLIPFTKCLSCITEFGYWAQIYKPKGMPSKGKVTLKTPGNITSSFRWEIQGLEHKKMEYVKSIERPKPGRESTSRPSPEQGSSNQESATMEE